MNDAAESLADIVADAKAARRELLLLEDDLQDDLIAIVDGAVAEGRDLTAGEIDRLKAHRATEREIREAITILAFVTAQRLDNSTDVARLHSQMQAINSGLQDDLARLKRIEKYAKIAAKAADALAKAAAKVAKKMAAM